MAKLTPTARSRISREHFGVPEKAPGSGSYPMPDRKHAAVAIGFAKMHHSKDLGRVEAKAHRLYPDMGES